MKDNKKQKKFNYPFGDGGALTATDMNIIGSMMVALGWIDEQGNVIGKLSGNVGPTGPAGPQGATGPQGIQGVTGLQGVTGIQGVTGKQGATGPRGLQGYTGARGPQGVTGPQGATGPMPELPIVYNKIDLGLKTSDGKTIYFADKNVGARSVEQPGMYFQWGSAKGRYVDENGNVIGDPFDNTHYEYYDNYTYSKYNEGYSIIAPEDDAATVHMGSEWKMPTKEMMDILLSKVTKSSTDSTKTIDLNVVYHDRSNPSVSLEKPYYYVEENYQGQVFIDDSIYEVDGLKFTSKTTGQSLYLPCVGMCSGSSCSKTSQLGSIYANYWMSDNTCDEEDGNRYQGHYFTYLYYPNFGNQTTITTNFLYSSRGSGYSVRGVCVE